MNTDGGEKPPPYNLRMKGAGASPVSTEAGAIELVIAAYTATARDGGAARKQAFDDAVSAYLSLRPTVSKEDATRAVANIICRQV